MRRALVVTAVLLAGTVVAMPPPASAAPPPPPPDYCGNQCSDILPPGQNGHATLADILAHRTLGTRPAHAADQLGKYAALPAGYRGLTTEKINDFFQNASFGVPADQVESVIRPRADVTIVRDKATGVPHITGTTRAGTEFGAGYAAAQDRLWLMDVLRHVGRGQLTPFAGGAQGNRQLEQEFFADAPYTEAELQRQIDTIAASGPRGAQGLADAQSYVDGINAYARHAHQWRYFPGEYVLTGQIDPITNAGEIKPFTLTDLVVLAAVIGSQFGAGGGGEVRNAIAKLALQERYGVEQGERVWQGLRSADDPETVHTVHNGQSFPYGQTPPNPQGTALPEPGSVTPQPLVFDQQGAAPANVAEPPRSGMSNALVVSGKYTESGHPVSVSGPQTGYFAPQLLMLQELQGPGISARGASFAGLSMYVLLGRGQDYSWSATSAGQDVTDSYAVELCEPSGAPPTKDSAGYRFRGECLPMQTVERRNAWRPTLADPTPAGSYTLRSYRTKYGPVTHRAIVGGKPVAYTRLRTSFLHEIDSLIGFQTFNDPAAIRSAQDFQRAAHQVNFTFNWFYADANNTAYFNSGTNPVRHPAVDPAMPVLANAGYDWQGWNPDTNTAAYTPFEQHPNAVDQDYFISWNNAQAPGYAAAGADKSSVHRGDLLDTRVRALINSGTKVTRVNLTQAMADAALVDLRAEKVLPQLLRIIDTAPVTGPAAEPVAALRSWLGRGAQRAEAAPGARRYTDAEAIRLMDAWWPLLVRGVFQPGLGENAYTAMTGVLKIDESPSQVGHRGSAYQSGWWGYVHKDVRAILGDPVQGPLPDRFCGGGAASTCRQVLLDTLTQAAARPASEIYPADGDCASGDQWCADSIIHRPLGGITHDKISTQNRPTYQQVTEFPGKRP